MRHIVICREDTDPITGAKGKYVLATRRTFGTPEEASTYAEGIAPGRDAIVAEGRFEGLRFEAPPTPQTNENFIYMLKHHDGRTICLVRRADDVEHMHVWPLDPRHDLQNHSPDGFAWGYAGSGPAQLALGMLVHHFEYPRNHVWFGEACSPRSPAEHLAVTYYQQFKFHSITPLDQEGEYELTTADVSRAIQAIRDEAREQG